MQPITIYPSSNLTAEQKQQIFQLWNEEYPSQLNYTHLDELDIYLNNVTDHYHLFASLEGTIIGWAFIFRRENEPWFAIIVSGNYHKNQIGSRLLDSLKENYNELNGWVTDHDNYRKNDQSQYLSPLPFYIKHGFRVCNEIRLNTEKLSAVKIKWNRSQYQR